MPERSGGAGRLLDATALAALALAVTRAAIQTITIDEADTFLMFVNPRGPAHWRPSSNNHLLNSMLMALFTTVFGVSHLAVRAPAILGACLYIAAARSLCRRISNELPVQWPLFVCLVLNPFVLDYLAAARGYSLALGFLTSVLAVAARVPGRPARAPASAGVCSACAALAFASNFSFAFVCAAALLAAGFWIAWEERVVR